MSMYLQAGICPDPVSAVEPRGMGPHVGTTMARYNGACPIRA
jgi:hypothetical protein